ncbi:zinc finger protein 385B-like [Conger conger]|uniref:zinc finger protein 385B-like n=1 Tax=Conger conger TaxID=82655 RepID=UPI002A5A2E37|nr:zinc finger protein 385B-like [Conger conger]
MKRPLSPTHLLENGGMCVPFGAYAEGEEPGTSHGHSQQEKKMLPFSLCEVCNIQLNSAAQAQVHYNGKSHLRRVKQLSNGDPVSSPGPCPAPLSTVSSGSSCHGSTLPALVRSPSLMPPQCMLDVKPFLSFSVDSASPVGLFPNFNTMDPVQKAVINHTFGVCVPPKKKHVISCSVCQLRFNSDSQAEAHYKGSKHAKKLKAQDSSKSKQKPAAGKDSAKTVSTCSSTATGSSAEPLDNKMAAPNVLKTLAPPKSPVPTATGVSLLSCLSRPVSLPTPGNAPAETANQGPAARSGATPPATAPTTAPPTGETEEEKAKKLLYCSLCKVAVNSLSQLEAHNTGSKHKTMLEARNGAGPIKAYPRPGAKLKVQATVVKGSGLQNKTFHCEICDVHVNSEIQLKQHISSRRHKDRVAGKPLKPKYSPYSKQQRSATVLAAKLALQKDLVKPLSPAFISSPFSPTSVASLPLHARPSTPLFQTATLSAPFLRAAPGAMRPAAGSTILFAPY